MTRGKRAQRGMDVDGKVLASQDGKGETAGHEGTEKEQIRKKKWRGVEKTQ